MKEKEEFVVESFALNLTESIKGFGPLFIENDGFYLEGNKGMVLKEGPAQTIQIKKEQILLPSKSEGFNIVTEVKKEELVSSHENRLQINAQYTVKFDHKENVKIVEKIIEKKKDWNQFNVTEKSNFNIIKNIKKIELIKQVIATLELKGKEMPEVKTQIIEKEKIKTIIKEWNDLLTQQNTRFGLLAKPKIIKKHKLLVANGDKFFIQKESDDEIIYNDDYNSRKQKVKEKEKVEARTQIIKEKEVVPRYQREIRAQIARVKESESDTSSISDIDVLAGIRNKNSIGVEGKINMANGYETKVLSGEVVFTAKNGLGVNLGGIQYQKQSKKKMGYTKSLSNFLSRNNKMSGIEISFNPSKNGGMNYEKMLATTGIIGEGNYKILNDNNNINKGKNGQTTINKNVIITRIQNNEMNGHSDLIITNKLNKTTKNIKLNGNLGKLTNQRSEGNLLLKKRESNKSNESPVSANNYDNINEQMKIGNIIFNSKIKSEKGQYSPNSSGNITGKNIIINSRKEYEKKIAMTGDSNISGKNEKKKNVEIKIKKSKVKNVENLRDFDY
jgi:hypothetical protein